MPVLRGTIRANCVEYASKILTWNHFDVLKMRRFSSLAWFVEWLLLGYVCLHVFFFCIVSSVVSF